MNILSRMPQEVNENLWYYEYPRGIEIVVEHQKKPAEIVGIPWKPLLASTKRYKAYRRKLRAYRRKLRRKARSAKEKKP